MAPRRQPRLVPSPEPQSVFPPPTMTRLRPLSTDGIDFIRNAITFAPPIRYPDGRLANNDVWGDLRATPMPHARRFAGPRYDLTYVVVTIDLIRLRDDETFASAVCERYGQCSAMISKTIA